MSDEACSGSSPYNGQIGLRVGGIFIILCTSAAGTLFPIISRRSSLRVPEWAFNGMKWFGSGIIVATAFIHLLAPAFDALSSPCLGGAWKEYDWAPAIAMSSVFGIFLVELVATRAGASFLKKRGLRHHDPHHVRGNDLGHTGHGTHPPAKPMTTALSAQEGIAPVKSIATIRSAEATGIGADLEAAVSAKDASVAAEGPEEAHAHGHAHSHEADGDDEEIMEDSAVSQCVGVAILEFGVIFHSFVIGLTLAVTDNLGPLLAVLTFHQTFEGIGLGSRLSMLRLPRKYNFVPFVAGVIYSCTTPLGIAVGLGIRETYNPDSTAASIVSGVLDATSAGILLWAGLVECLAHDFVFDRQMADASNGQVTYAVTTVFTGAGLMALLGRWA
ncbi:hypothetical protein JCM10908_000186 [Rhodotorula pacifica]|uniref:uncharacterized protein n=1 Tax=Rhodotorula pacifica TaxID=1495444 RepID=UPI00316DD886